MKAQPLKVTEGGYQPCRPLKATHIQLNMPGPIPTRIVPVTLPGRMHKARCWHWNGDTEKPTLTPSLLSDTADGDKRIRCHSFVTDGMACFLGDCSHELAGRRIPLLEVD